MSLVSDRPTWDVQHAADQPSGDSTTDGSGLVGQTDASSTAIDIQAAASGQGYVWIGGTSGNWNDAANWFDASTDQVASTAPGQNDSVSIPGGDGTTITGTGAAHDLTLSGRVLLDGTFSTGTLIDTDASSSSAVSLSAEASLTVLGNAATPATLAPGAVLAADGSVSVDGVTPSDGVVTASIDGDGVQDGSAVSPDSHTGFLTVQTGAVLLMPSASTNASIWNDGTIELSAGSAIPTGQIQGRGTVLIDSGFEASVSTAGMSDTGPSLGAQQQIRFNGPNASLFIASGGDDASTPILVQNFQELDDISVAGSVQDMQVVNTANGDLLELVELVGGVHGEISTQYIQFDQSYAASNLAFSLSFVGTGAFDSGYTNITLSEATACFCPGTMIATPDGDSPVETLRIGDLVRTQHGPDQPVLWIGRRSYRQQSVAGRADLLPIRIRAGALGAGLPRRDLLVSPRHAMLVQGVLVPAELLVNNRSVLRQKEDGDVDYLHLELDNHELLFAEGAATESFADDNSRAMFQNAAEYALLYPDRPSRPPCWRAPRVEHGERLLSAQAFVNLLAGLPLHEAPAGLRGHVDAIEGRRVRGWAWCPEQPEAPVLLEILADDVPVARVLADRYRADLGQAGIGTGCHGFEAVVPDGAGSVTVRRVRDGQRLAA